MRVRLTQGRRDGANEIGPERGVGLGEICMRKLLQVALLIETSNAYGRGLLEGIAGYLREHPRWSVYLAEHGRGDTVPFWLNGWKGDGILARIENRAVARAVSSCRLPTVDLSAARLIRQIPWVETDNAAIARLAADHLLERGFRRFGFCGLSNFRWSTERGEEFTKCVTGSGHTCSTYVTPISDGRAVDWAADQRRLVRWIQKLPKPAGVLACFDMRGRQVLDACRTAGVRVPDEIAVLGVDDDTVLCELADPPLSSIAPAAQRAGFAAAELLERMMRGEKVKPVAQLFPPRGAVTRRSTDALVIEDPDVSAVVGMIRERACRGITVEEIVAAVPLSRRVLESRFRKLLGRTPHQEIVRCRIEAAKQLLASTDLPIKVIAQKTGSPHAEYLNARFKLEVGMTPGAYRRQAQRSRSAR
jgi:LacI family transcriptional regulator